MEKIGSPAEETEKRIALAVKQFEDNKVTLDELEKIVGAVALVGYLKTHESKKLTASELDIFLKRAIMI